MQRKGETVAPDKPGPGEVILAWDSGLVHKNAKGLDIFICVICVICENLTLPTPQTQSPSPRQFLSGLLLLQAL